ncbi:Pumilio y domain member 6 [Saxophila tyrrhenica]|uniref:Pumilio y domain member 6 n=1 Tax=Saxophila tyrrhenica TaxID=1690608 RepID=A0AAV9P997_9PEZI|nr:Pumilio y domain member 6 [Saxophila tyrrhenica]
MGGIKRKDAPSDAKVKSKKLKKEDVKPAKERKSSRKVEVEADGGEDGFGGFSDEENGGVEFEDDEPVKTNGTTKKVDGAPNDPKQFKPDNTSSAEAHAKQRALAKERKASKPHADAIQRSKKIWERLRRKSHVPGEERKQLVAELFDIITGRVSDFVFKHDSVRVIQCALKYANATQRQNIAQELKGDIKTLAESKYGKFLVAKMISTGDETVRDTIVPEFYGHVRRLVNHPEASWVVDDIYRQIATQQQKATMLREWYGAEFALFHRKPGANAAVAATTEDTADLVIILERNPEKRKPILQYLLQMINGLVQKKMTGFTMLHDAMLQYFLALKPSSEEHTEFLEILKGDIDKEVEGGGGDLFRNLAFTKSGSRLVCLALAYGNAKDRRTILRVFKNAIEVMALDQYAKMVLVVGLDVTDDTKTSTRILVPELFGQHITDSDERLNRIEALSTNLHARLPILYPLSGMAKWLIPSPSPDHDLLTEMHSIRAITSKKAPETRRSELLETMTPPLLDLVAARADSLARSSFGCQVITEVLLSSPPSEQRDEASKAVAELAAGEPGAEGHLAHDAAAGRMLKSLVLGGAFDAKTKKVILPEEGQRLGFAAQLYPVIKDSVLEWACGEGSFVIVGLLESEDVEGESKAEVKKLLKKGRKKLEGAAKGGKGGEGEVVRGNAGARILGGLV